MKNLIEKINKLKRSNKDLVWKPELLDLNDQTDFDRVTTLFNDGKIVTIVDELNQQQQELFVVDNPESLKDNKLPSISTEHKDGIWIYYEWRRSLVHLLHKVEFEKLRISRNHSLITLEEQAIFKQINIGFAGLNVGNPGALCIALEGGSNFMKLADFDILSLSNMNRFRANLSDLGMNKAFLTARQIFETNPFAELDVFPEGITNDNVLDFLLNPRIDLLIEETDNLKLKINLRKLAKEHRIPVLMVTGNGSNIIIDVERYDLDSNLPLLNGKMKQSVMEEITSDKSFDFDTKIKLARDFMGRDILAKRLNRSFDLVGSKLAGIPQLAEASYLRGATLAWFARNIFLDNFEIKSGRYFLELDKLLDQN